MVGVLAGLGAVGSGGVHGVTLSPAAGPVRPTTTLDAPTTTTTSPPTTVPPTTRPPLPAPAVAETRAPAPAAAPAPAPAPAPPITAGYPTDVPPSPDFLASCSAASYDDSPGCVNTTLAAIANARHAEGLGPMVLPANWYSLTAAEQIFVATDLERTARGLVPLSAMASALDADAAQAAAAGGDPTPPSGFPWTAWGSNWAGGLGNPLEAMYLWMYDDGVGSGNRACTSAASGGCWAHRRTVLLALVCTQCVMGAGSAGTSQAEIVVETQGTPAVDFTWAQA